MRAAAAAEVILLPKLVVVRAVVARDQILLWRGLPELPIRAAAAVAVVITQAHMLMDMLAVPALSFYPCQQPFTAALQPAHPP